MVSQDFRLFSQDPVLTTLRQLDIDTLKANIVRNVPDALVSGPVAQYRVTNVRYTPKQKLVIGLNKPRGETPISIRIFPESIVADRLMKARRSHPAHSFPLHELNGIAWVFPGERKIDASLLNDRERLAATLQLHRGYELSGVELVHVVPEHTITARVTGVTPGNEKTEEFLKIYYDDSGAKTAAIMREVSQSACNSQIEFPGDVTYLPDDRTLVQPGLPVDERRRLDDAAAVCALSAFHRLQAQQAATPSCVPEQELAATAALVAETCPSLAAPIDGTSLQLLESLAAFAPSPSVLLHGDAHPGNLLPLQNGRIGVIDFDRVRYGAAEDDLASYFGFSLWQGLRRGATISTVLRQFPKFVQRYNDCADRPVCVSRAYVVLAYKMIVERLYRGIRRGKCSDSTQMLRFVEIADDCLRAAERIHD